MTIPSVQCYFLSPTENAPNNTLPVLHYRNVLPLAHTEESTTAFLEANKWEKRGTWGHIPIRHFHPNTHECYGIFQGKSTALIGALDEYNETTTTTKGLKLELRAGDVIVLPAGTAHSNLVSTDDYRYIGVYPRGCEKWRSEYGKEHVESFRETIAAVEPPEADPVYGDDGPLMHIWLGRGGSAAAIKGKL